MAHDATSRLIPDAYADPDESSLQALADTADDLAALNQLAAATNARLQAQEERHPGGLGRADMVFGVPYSKIVNASFAYAGTGARFHDRRRGAWYCALEVETAIAEVGFHRRVMLAEIGLTSEVVSYREFLSDIHADDFADLSDGSAKSNRCLDPDSYLAGQALAADLLARQAGGVRYPAVRDPGGTNLAVLQPALVAHVRPGAEWQLTVDGDDVSARPIR
ncbi:MAG: RES family NAD+ phosphorylase [Nocardioidaceae bacterium]